MNAQQFIKELAAISLPNVFNPYADQCTTHDRKGAAKVRRSNLTGYLQSIESIGADTIWMGRDLGYRGGRRTGLALTDESNLQWMEECYPGSKPARATVGPAVAERTATEIWAAIRQLKLPPLLWNVFPFHPHEEDDEMTNRRFSSGELHAVDALNRELISWLKIRRIVCIGQDAAKYAEKFGVEVECIRHPSYGGVRDFRAGIQRLYDIVLDNGNHQQPALF
jgi:hypothetical protein